jgi:branched-chain amino acid aminotransferase
VKEYIYLNGHYVLKNEAKISVFDRGFLYGDGLFETMRSYDGKIFKLKEHLGRLYNSSRELSIEVRFNKTQLEKDIYGLLKMNDLRNAHIRLTVSRGASEEGIVPSNKDESTVVIFAKEFHPYPDFLYENGMKTIIVKVRRDQSSALVKHKTLNFLTGVLAKIEVKEAGVDEGIFLNYNDNVAEGAVSNIFIVKNNVLITPVSEDGILPGITRETVIELARELLLEIEERHIKKEEIFSCDECFLTNSLMEIMPVALVDGVRIGNGRVGKITKLLLMSYKRLVNEY